MNENTREAKALNGQETKTIEAGVTEMSEQLMENVAGGMQYLGDNHEHKFGPRYKKKSLFGWNWYAKCKICKAEIKVKDGPWSGDPD